MTLSVLQMRRQADTMPCACQDNTRPKRNVAAKLSIFAVFIELLAQKRQPRTYKAASGES
jgi:hypothetical protein